jgi:hypothetical protein
MTTRSTFCATVAALGLLMFGGGNAAIAQTSTTTNKAQCFTDDGYGRLRSCSQRYKKANPNWRTSENCYTSEGNRRYRSCSSGSVGYKRKQ